MRVALSVQLHNQATLMGVGLRATSPNPSSVVDTVGASVAFTVIQGCRSDCTNVSKVIYLMGMKAIEMFIDASTFVTNQTEMHEYDQVCLS